MSTQEYTLSFTTGGLFHRESITLAMLFFELNDWDTVRDQVLSENLLQSRTLNTSKRQCREIISRLKTLGSQELDLLIRGSNQEQTAVLWLAVCRRYTFIADFAVEVLRERHITCKMDLNHEDFDSFFYRKSEWHTEMDEITPTTRNKLRQVLFKMLREAGLITAKNKINAAIFSKRFLYMTQQGNPREFLYFPVFESDLKRGGQ
jgi:hypothetical protein